MTRLKAAPATEAIVAAMFLANAYLALSLYPVLFADLLAAGRATIPQLSRMATADYLTAGLVGLAAPALLSLRHVRLKALVAALLMTAGNLLTTRLHGDAIILSRITAGIGGGIFLWLQFAYIARRDNPELLGGLFMAANVALTVVGAQLNSAVIVPRFGVDGTFVFMAAMAAVTGGAALLLGPADLEPASRPSAPAAVVPLQLTKIPVPAKLVLASVFLTNAFAGTIWIYLEPIASKAGISRSLFDMAMAASLVAQGLGALAGSLLSRHLNPAAMLISMGAIFIGESALLVFGVLNANIFTIVVLLFGFISYAMFPFAIAMLIARDPSRRSVDYFSAPLILGSGFGPLLASLVVSEDDVGSGVRLASVWAILSLAALLAACVPAFRPRQPEPTNV